MTDPQLNIINSRTRECGAEPGRVVELTARVQCTTPLTVPEGIVCINTIIYISWARISSSTEVVISYKGRKLMRPVSISTGTGTVPVSVITSVSFIDRSSKGPDVLSRTSNSVSKGDTIKVRIF